ncbi:MAG: 5-nucleotidase [Pedobacter sp.]|jgi:5'-nucleotidase (lipoprotein e(P4) family)|nr:5-nucleotidase [Pedobacter sp.]
MRRIIVAIVSLLLPFGLKAQDTAANAGVRDYTTAVLWQQHSGEYRALAFQAYNFAQLSLVPRLAETNNGKKNCVVVDVDETVLDNSPFQGYEIRNNKIYDQKDWFNWTSKGIADTVPGAAGFLKFAASKGVETFYVSNRGVSELESTRRNLQQLGFPFADKAHMLFKTNTSDKEARRKMLLERYNILLLCGDNLSDFSNVFYREGKNTIEQVNAMQQLFGTRFVVLPNPMYGDWEKPIYKRESKTEAGKSQERLEGLKSY